MTTFVFANNIDTTLASSISSSATTITLSSGTNLPALAAGQTFVVTLNDAATRQIFEIMYATAISGTTLTVSRAQEGTTAQAWAAGDYVFSGPTARQMRSFYQGQSVGQGSVTSVGMSMPSGFSVSGSPITVAGTLSVTFASQNAGLFLATPVTGGAAGAATWRSMAAADVNGALGYTAANAADVVNTFNGRLGAVTLSSTDVDGALGYTPVETVAIASANGISGTVAVSGATQTATIALGAITPNSISCSGASSAGSYATSGNINCAALSATGALAAQTATFTQTGAYAPYWIGTTGDPNKSITLKNDNAGGFIYETSWYGTDSIAWVMGSSSITAMKLSNAGALTLAGSLTATTANFTSSDRRMKRNIQLARPRPLHRKVPFVSYVLKENGWHGLGSVAQAMRKVAREHVGEFDWHGKKRLSLNYAGAAYEEAMWAGHELDQQAKIIETQLKRIQKLEARLAALERRV